MIKVDAKELLLFVKTLEDQTLETRARKHCFKVRATAQGLEFTPVKTQKARMESFPLITRCCQFFSETNSFERKDYDFTLNGSYLLAIIGKFINR